MHNKRLRGTLALAGAIVLGALTGIVTTAPVDAAPKPGPATLVGDRGAVADPATALGATYRKSGDVLVRGVGDTDGFHIMVAREKDAYAWSTLATLGTDIAGLSAFTGYTCVTGSGKYVVAVYAPAIAANKPALVKAGGFAAVVDVASGRVRQLATRVELAYFNPACGPTDRVLLTRSIGDNGEKTDLLAVDAVSGRVTGTRRIDAQVTSPTASATADYGIVRGRLTRIDATGALHGLAAPAGQPFAVRATASGAVDVVSADDSKAIAQRFENGTVTDLGSAPREQLQLAGLTGGRNALVGATAGLRAAGRAQLVAVPSTDPVEGVSTEGHLLLNRAQSRQVTASTAAHGSLADPTLAGKIDITVQAVHSRRSASGTITATTVPSGTASIPAPIAAKVAAAAAGPADPGPATCSISRNMPYTQAYQPSVKQIEWAVDLVVHNNLKVQRPANYLKTGLPAYTPQGMFPNTAANAGKVPAQLMLAILAQETNMAQASWHAVPGDAGNPLIADYYGNGNANFETIDYGKTDCGYGIGQVTTGMKKAETGTVFSGNQQEAIAVDYAANVAASLRILEEKWDQTKTAGATANDQNPKYIENWFFAVWGYNSGVYAPGQGTPFGVGWLNNPANPRYPSNRQPFLRASLDDASHPGDWPYEEKVMGWAERPQWQWVDGLPAPKYLTPAYGAEQAAALHLYLPYDAGHNYMLFCSTAWTGCHAENTGNPCPNNDSTCWYTGQAWWANCATQCSTERLLYQAGEAEPATERTYPKDCTTLAAPSGVTLRVVDDLPDQSDNVLGCSGGTQSGKFTLRTGLPTGDTPMYDVASGTTGWATHYSEFAQVDLHQLGAGYQGHMWFTHTYPDDRIAYHQVVGTWTPDLPSTTAKYDVLVHLPSHGGQVSAKYLIYPTSGTTSPVTCAITQDTGGVDKWVYVGTPSLSQGGRIMLSNSDAAGNGNFDIAFDAMAFMTQKGTTTHACGAAYAG